MIRRDGSSEAAGEPAESVLDGPDEEYLRDGATTAEDLSVLSPRAQVRVQLEDADPGLDADVEAWFAADCDLPRLTLLGPVGARTRGDAVAVAVAVAKRKAYFVEMLAYLGTHPRGATPAQLALVRDHARARPYRHPDGAGLARVNPRSGQ